MLASPSPEEILDTALHALATIPDWRSVLDELAVPIYTTDADFRRYAGVLKLKLHAPRPTTRHSE